MKANILKVVAAVLLLAAAVSFYSCGTKNEGESNIDFSRNIMENNGEELTSLEGTTWKLAGIVDTKSGVLKVLEPKNCGRCYVLIFDTDSTFSTHSCSNELSGRYVANYVMHSIQVTCFGGTKLGERGDGSLWWEIFPTIESFSLQKHELRLYYVYNNKKNYLLFKLN